MKKPKSKLERAKERLISGYKYKASIFMREFWDPLAFRRQLNNLIRLAKKEEREGK